MISKKEAIEKQARFMSKMDEQLDWLKEQTSIIPIELTYNGKDFDNIERIFDYMSEDVSKEDISTLYVTIGRYLGEDFRRNFGGEWTVCLDEKNPHYGFPVIEGFSDIEGFIFPPIFTVKAYGIRRNKGSIQRAVNSYIKPKPLDLSHLPTEIDPSE